MKLKLPVVAGILLAIAIIGAIIYTTFGNQGFRVEVCMSYQGRKACRIASASAEAAALRTATGNACALISNGSFDSARCENGQPESVKWLNGR
jgi:hypothetical protein